MQYKVTVGMNLLLTDKIYYGIYIMQKYEINLSLNHHINIHII